MKERSCVFKRHPERFKVKNVCHWLICIFVIAAIGLGQGVSAFAAENKEFYVCYPVYMQSGIYVFPVKYTVPQTTDLITDLIKEALNVLIKGIPGSDIIYPMFPTDTEVLSVSVKDDLCTVNFGDAIRHMSVGSGGELAAVAGIVSTVCQFENIDRVQILIEGEPTESLAGHVDTSLPLSDNWGYRFVPLEDVEQHWSGGYVGALQLLDVVNGYEDQTFKPEKYVSRAEFLKMAVECCGAKDAPEQNIPFGDVPEKHWINPYLKAALAAKIIDPDIYGDSFGPDETIPREEMAFILVQAHDIYLDMKGEEPSSSGETTFTDFAEVKDVFKDAVQEAVARGLLNGYPDKTFKPKGGLKRGEAATAIGRMRGIRGNTSVVIISPEPEVTLGDEPVYILGLATAFEATVNLDVLSDEGEVIIADYSTSTNGLGWGAFGYALNPEQLKGHKPATIRVYLVSPEDSSYYSMITTTVN